MNTVLMRITWGILVAAMMVGVTGCMGDIKDYCEVSIKCAGGNENDEEACIERYKAEKKWAGEYGCRKEWKDAMECIALEASRFEDGPKKSCNKETFEEDPEGSSS